MAAISYNRVIRKLVVGFGNLFKDITLVRYNPNLTEAQRFLVPITYATKEFYVRRLEGDPNLDKKVQITLPRMSFEMSGLNYDVTRKLNTNVKSFARTTTGTISQYNPVPYDFDFNLYIYVRNIEDGTQIIEHILPFFAPDYTIKLNLIPEMGIIKEVPVILNSTTNEIQYEGNKENETRLIIWTLNFTVKGFVFGKTSTTNLITHSITNILNNVTSNDLVLFEMNNNGLGTYQVGEIVYQGYSAQMATATAKVTYWSDNTLHLTEINGNFISNEPIIGQTSGSNYLFTAYQIQPKTLARINVTPMPTDANVTTPRIAISQISETPDIDFGLLPTDFAGDLMEQVGRDDLHIIQEKRTDLQ
jgi:hypothetical protein